MRRIALTGLCAATLSFAWLIAVPDAAKAAKIGNPGSGFTLKVQSGSIRVGNPPDDNSFDFQDEGRLPQCSDGVNNDEGQDTLIDAAGGDPQCAGSGSIPASEDDSEVQSGYQPKQPIQMTNGTITAAGAVTFPQANVSFPPAYLWVQASSASGGVVDDFVATIRILPLANFTGTLNANTGTMDLRMQVKVSVTGGPLSSGCEVNPIDMNMLITGTTSPPGPNTPISGVPYNASTGRMTLVNNSFSVPGAQNCGTVAFFYNLNNAINDQLKLPSAAGKNEARFVGEFTPTRPTPAVVATFTATPSSGPAPLNVSFNSAGSTTGAGVTTQWDFTNDGTFDATGATASRTYNSAGAYTARLRVTDSGGDFVETTRLILVGANQPPTANDQVVSTPEDTAKSITLTGTDPEGQALTFALAAPSPAHGTLSGTAPNIVYTPAPNYNGPDSFGFTATDPFNNVDHGLVSINVTPVNDPPVAVNVSASTAEDTPVAVTLVASDIDGDPVTYSVVTGPTKGVLSGTAPNLLYTPNLNENGVDTFTFRATDPSNASSNVATATINITPVNDPPVANAQSLSTNEDNALAITLTGSDVETPSPVFSLVTTPGHGALSGSLPNLTYTPAANYNGPDSFVFRVTDANGAADTATIDITVVPVNDAPTAVGANLSTNQDTPVTAHIVAADVDGDALSFTPTSPTPGGGTVDCVGADCTYTPAAGFFGNDSFDVGVDDGNGGVTTVTVTISVSVVNNTAPVGHDATFVTIEDAPRNFTLDASDADGDPLTFAVLTQPAAGSASCSSAGVCTFTPAPNGTATQSFVVRASDGRGGVADITVTILIAPVNDLPVVPAASLTTAEDTSGSVNLIATDVDGDTLTWTLKQAPLHGSVVCTSGGACTYTPAANYNGSDSFDAEVNDGHGGRVRITVPVSITPVNDAPTAGTVYVSVNEDGAKAFNLMGGDPDGGSVTFSAAPATRGTLSCSSAGACNYITLPDVNGTETVAYTVSDGVAVTTGAIVIVIVPVNDAPTTSNLTISTPEDTAVIFTLPAFDVDGDTLTVTLTSAPSQGSLSGVLPDLTYRPAPDASGVVTFGFTVRDVAGASANGVVTIMVTPVDDLPVANSISVTTPEDAAKAITLTGSDAEGPVTVTVTSAPAHGTYGGGVYTPALNYNGPDSIGFSVTDSASQVANGTVSITVTPVNDPPVASGGNVTTTRTVAVPITLSATDVDGDVLTFTVLTGPAHGSLAGTAPDLTYTPTGFYTGPDTVTFKATDAAGATSSNTIHITVNQGAPLATTLVVGPATVTKPSGPLGGLQKYKYTNLNASLRTVSGDLPVPGVSIRFSVNSSTICQINTNSNGVAICNNGQGPREDSPTYNATFAGNANFAGSTGTGPLS